MQCKLILAAPLALKFYNRANKFRLPDQLMVGAGNSRHRAARQENRHEGLFLAIPDCGGLLKKLSVQIANGCPFPTFSNRQ